MGNKLTNVEFRAFRNCKALKSITVQNPTVPDANEDAFNYYTATLYVPDAGLANYKAHEVWGKFVQILPIVENLYLIIAQSESGRVKMPVTKGMSYAVVIEAEEGWKINTLTYNGMDVTEQIVDGVFTTPAMYESGELRVAYESVSNAVSALSFNNIKVYGQSGNIVVKNAEVGEIIRVYTTDGKLTNTTIANGNDLYIGVSTGATYIVKAGLSTLKIAM